MKKTIITISVLIFASLPCNSMPSHTHTQKSRPTRRSLDAHPRTLADIARTYGTSQAPALAGAGSGAPSGRPSDSRIVHPSRTRSQVLPYDLDAISHEEIEADYDRVHQWIPSFKLPTTTPDKAGSVTIPMIYNTRPYQATLHTLDGVLHACINTTLIYIKSYTITHAGIIPNTEAQNRQFNLIFKGQPSTTYEDLACINKQIKKIEAIYDKKISDSFYLTLTLRRLHAPNKRYTLTQRNGMLYVDSKDDVPVPDAEIEQLENSLFYQLICYWNYNEYYLDVNIKSKHCCVIS